MLPWQESQTPWSLYIYYHYYVRGREMSTRWKTKRKPSIHIWLRLYLDATLSPSVSPAYNNQSPGDVEEPCYLLTQLHLHTDTLYIYIYIYRNHQPDVEERDSKSSFIKHLDHPSSLWYTLQPCGHMAWESSTARCQVAIFYNTIQWLDSWAVTKKGLCVCLTTMWRRE